MRRSLRSLAEVSALAIALTHPSAEAQNTKPRNWGLESTQAENAWSLRSENEVIVAIIDTGVDIKHPALRGRLWTNPGETGLDSQGKSKASNGIDDDGNGYVDDVHGWNFVDDSPDLTDRHGHGTHIAGIIDSVANGPNPRIKLMALKYYDPRSGEQNAISNTVSAIRYAVKMGAKIINYSAGGAKPNEVEKNAIEAAREKGVVFVAAAGNEASNSDRNRYYPADYGLSNILSVTAIDPRRRVLSSSNYGLNTVHLAAPGEDILSPVPGGLYGKMTGTSQATAFASAIAALVVAQTNGQLDPERIIQHVIATGELSPTLAGKTKSQTIANAYRALAIRDSGFSANGIYASNSAAMDESLFTLEANVATPTLLRP